MYDGAKWGQQSIFMALIRTSCPKNSPYAPAPVQNGLTLEDLF